MAGQDDPGRRRRQGSRSASRPRRRLSASLFLLPRRGRTEADARSLQGLLSHVQTVDCADDKTLCLSLDWSTRRQATSECVPSLALRWGEPLTKELVRAQLGLDRRLALVRLDLHPRRRVVPLGHERVARARLRAVDRRLRLLAADDGLDGRRRLDAQGVGPAPRVRHADVRQQAQVRRRSLSTYCGAS